MGQTVENLVTRMYREYLSPMNDTMLFGRVNEALDASETDLTLNIADGILTPEEIDLLGEGISVEVDYEKMLVTAYSSPTLTVVRGWLDTTAATHTDGATMYIAPWVARSAVLDAVYDAIVDLGADLWVERTQAVTVAKDPTSLPASTTEVSSFLLDSGGSGGAYEFLHNWPLAGTGRAVRFLEAPVGADGWITYFSKFPRPTATTDDLTDTSDDWAIPLEWFKIIMVDALATLVVAKQTDQIQTDFITELLAQEGFDIGESQDVVQMLLTLRSVWIDRHVKRKRQTEGGIRTVVNRR